MISKLCLRGSGDHLHPFARLGGVLIVLCEKVLFDVDASVVSDQSSVPVPAV